MADVLKKFGKYFLLDRLAQGGMAEIFRARLASVDGAGRIIVIKRIQAGFGSNSEFLQMFKSEIKVTMGFNHPNIAQLYDFGEEESQPYIAMELVDGKNLRQFMNRFNELKQTLPIELAIFIAEQAASGLHYAHTFKNKISGDPFHIVHRDISPQNILISYEGNVKVIDFGIAKATTNIEATRAGVIKGKPSYLSPEQIGGDELDGRSDIFALGAVLWEILTGRKLFSGENDLAVLKKIESCDTYTKPPSTINPKIPKELDYIILKCLSKNPENRYQSAEELQRSLHKGLYNYMGDFNPSDLGYYAKDLFKNEIVEDRKRIQRLNEKVETLLASDRSQFTDPAAISSIKLENDSDTTTIVKKRIEASGGRSAFSAESPSETHIEVEAKPQFVPRAREPSLSQSLATPTLKKISTSPPLQRYTTERSSSLGLREILGGVIGMLVLISLFGPQFGISIPVLSSLLALTPKKVSPNPNGKTPASVDPSGILLTLNLTPSGGSPVITVSGKPVDVLHPSVKVTLDAPLEIVVERPGYKPFRRETVLDSKQLNGLKEWLMEIPLEPLHFGFLSIRTTPSADAIIMMPDGLWKQKTPLENQKLPVGSYDIQLNNEVLGMQKKIHVEIQEGKAINIDERLGI